MELPQKLIEEIADELDCGLKIYLNKETMEKTSVPDFYGDGPMDEEMWADQFNEIDENIDKFIIFEKMDSRESFSVIRDFVDTVDNEKLKDQLELGISLVKPFRNFKDIISGWGEYREKWFQFKKERYIEYVKEQLEYLDD